MAAIIYDVSDRVFPGMTWLYPRKHPPPARPAPSLAEKTCGIKYSLDYAPMRCDEIDS